MRLTMMGERFVRKLLDAFNEVVSKEVLGLAESDIEVMDKFLDTW